MAEAPRDAEEAGRAPGGGAARGEGAPDPDLDPREEDGWDQPQSSAQKGPSATGEPEE